jgi:hypothetical protein
MSSRNRVAVAVLSLFAAVACACKPAAAPTIESRGAKIGPHQSASLPAPSRRMPVPHVPAPDAAPLVGAPEADPACRRPRSGTDLCASLRQVVAAGMRDDFRSLGCGLPTTTGWVPARVYLPGSMECAVQVGMLQCTMRPIGSAQQLAERLACCQPGWLVHSEPWGVIAPDASFSCLLGTRADGRPTVECYVQESPEVARGALSGYRPTCAPGPGSAPSFLKQPPSAPAAPNPESR